MCACVKKQKRALFGLADLKETSFLYFNKETYLESIILEPQVTNLD